MKEDFGDWIGWVLFAVVAFPAIVVLTFAAAYLLPIALPAFALLSWDYKRRQKPQRPKRKSQAQLRREANIAAMYARAEEERERRGVLTRAEQEDAALFG